MEKRTLTNMGKTKEKWKEKKGKKHKFLEYSEMVKKDHSVKRKGC